MAKKSSFKIPGLSFSWKRALGITSAKRRTPPGTPMQAGREKRGLLRRRYRGSSATPTTPLPQIYTSIRQRRNWCRPLKRRKFVSSLLVTYGSQGKPVQNCSAKSCKIATNVVIFINFCAYIFKTIIIQIFIFHPALDLRIGGFFCALRQQDGQFITHQCFYRYAKIIGDFLLRFRVWQRNAFCPI